MHRQLIVLKENNLAKSNTTRPFCCVPSALRRHKELTTFKRFVPNKRFQ